MLKYIKIAAGFLLLLFAEMFRELHSFRVTSYKFMPFMPGQAIPDKAHFREGVSAGGVSAGSASAGDVFAGGASAGSVSDEGVSAGSVSGGQNGAVREHRLVFLSDLHNQVYGKGNARLLRAVRKEKPEVILIGGDMLVGKAGQSCRAAADFVKELARFCPVYYANGNHEQRMKEEPECYGKNYFKYKEELESAGIHFLENESAEIRLGEWPVRITGLEIPLSCYGRLGRRELTERQVEERIGKCPSSVYEILLAHNPSYMKTYFNWGADLVLSGHFHGGVVRIPGIAGVISPGFRIFPRYSGGIYREGTQTAVVSKGLGSHTIPVRLFNPAEVIVLKTCEQDGNHV